MKRIYLAAGLAAVLLLGGCTSGESGGTEEVADEPEQTEQASGEVTVIRTVYQYEEPEEEPEPEPEVVAQAPVQEVAPSVAPTPQAPPAKTGTPKDDTFTVRRETLTQEQVIEIAKANGCYPSCQGAAIARGEVPGVPPSNATQPPAPQITPQQQANRDRLAQLQKEYDGTGPSPWVQHQQEMAGQ